jgi:hypothetical protein
LFPANSDQSTARKQLDMVGLDIIDFLLILR